MKKKLLALFVTLALIVAPVATVSCVLTANKTSAEAAVVYLDEDTPAKTQIKGTWGEDGKFTPENEEDAEKYTVTYFDAEGAEVAFEELVEGTAFRAVATIKEEFAENHEFDETIRKAEEPTVAEQTYPLPSGGENNDDNNNGEPEPTEPETPRVPMDMTLKTNIVGYVVVALVVVCALFALILVLSDKNKGDTLAASKKKKKE